jgi:hypothetical protein
MAIQLRENTSHLSCLKPAKGEYCRDKTLPGLLKLWPRELDDYSYPGTLRLVALLRNALRAERCRARAGHWAYDLSRHLALMSALRAERERLKMLGRALPAHAGPGQAPSARPRLAGTLHLPAREAGA